MSDDITDALTHDREMRDLRHELSLAREEISGQRAVGEGAVAALVGSQRAYGAVSQLCNMLMKQIEALTARVERLEKRAPP